MYRLQLCYKGGWNHTAYQQQQRRRRRRRQQQQRRRRRELTYILHASVFMYNLTCLLPFLTV